MVTHCDRMAYYEYKQRHDFPKIIDDDLNISTRTFFCLTS